MPQVIAVLDFGSQLTQVIARRIRECEVYSRIYHYSTPAAKLKAEGVAGIILSGGPQSVYAKSAPHPDPEIFRLGVPMLGICYGVQLMGHFLGGKVAHSKAREYGHGVLTIRRPGRLFKGLHPDFKATRILLSLKRRNAETIFGAIAREIAKNLRPGAILTDVGSVKAAVVRDVGPHVPKGVHFVPGHPIAGTEQSGPESGFEFRAVVHYVASCSKARASRRWIVRSVTRAPS